MRWLVTAVAWLFLAVLPSHLHAKPELHVLAVQSDQLRAAAALTQALKAAIAGTRYELGSGEYSLEVMALALGCEDPPDTTCLQAIADKIKARAVLWGSLERREATHVASLHLFRPGQRDASVELRYAAKRTDGSDPTLKELASRAVAELLRGARGATVAEVEAKPDPVAEAAASVTLEDTPAPAAPPAEPAPAARRTAWPAWAAIGGGVALVGAGVFSAVRSDQLKHEDDFDRYRAGFTTNKNACEEAENGSVVEGAASPDRIRDLCREAHTYEVLEYVFFGLGAAAVGTGTLILLTQSSEPEQSARVRVTPRLAPRQASLAVDVRF